VSSDRGRGRRRSDARFQRLVLIAAAFAVAALIPIAIARRRVQL
jgi:hypothetical protein